MMLAKITIGPDGRLTHVRVLRTAWPNLKNTMQINRTAIESLKGWRYDPTTVEGKPAAVCTEVAVNADLY